MPELIRTALGKGPLSVTNLQAEILPRYQRRSTTLVSTIAKRIGETLASRTLLNKHEEKQKLLYEAWNAFFCEFMTAGIDIHHIAGQQTAFAAFLSGFFEYFDMHRFIYWALHRFFRIKDPTRTCNAALKIWLADLQIVGVDLDEFGRIEQQFYNSGYVYKDIYRWSMEGDGASERLINFTYGSSPDDWHVWFSERTDPFVGDFWNLIERQAEVMPGAWPEDLPYKM